MIPNYSPPLYIFPDLDILADFRWWTLQLISMTLLEPLVDNPNYETLEPTEWLCKHIPVGVQPNGHVGGVRVMLDSGGHIFLMRRHMLMSMQYCDPREHVLCSSTTGPASHVDAVVQHAGRTVSQQSGDVAAAQPGLLRTRRYVPVQRQCWDHLQSALQRFRVPHQSLGSPRAARRYDGLFRTGRTRDWR